MKKLFIPFCAVMLLLLVALLPTAHLPVKRAFTPLFTVTFENDEEGNEYRSNTFDNGASDVWTRSVSNDDGPNDNMSTYSGYLGNVWWSGEDIDSPDNPIAAPNNSGYIMLKTLDVSAYQGGKVQVSAYLAGNTSVSNRYRANDFLKIKYAFDADIATGANSVDGLPIESNLITGNYTTFAAFYGSGTTTATSSALVQDTDLDGANDKPSGADSLKNAFAQWTFEFPIGNSDNLVSILFEAITSGGSEEIGIDHIVVSAETGSVAPTSATVAASAFLEGAYNGSILNTGINASIPAQQPYNGINLHSETTNVTSMPASAVDWVLVELREAASAADALNSTRVGSAAGLLMSDGSIKATDGSSDLPIALSGHSGSSFYVVVYHRNHLPIMSAAAISESGGTYSIDFTRNAANTYQTTTALASLSGSKFGLPAGDIDQDGDIDAVDLSTWRTNNGISFSYGSNGAADFNLDGVINAVDRNEFHQKNTSKTRQVPSG